MAEEQLEEPIIASTSQETESVATIPCAICRRQFSRYTCPRCNIPYCSLVCFRSEKHGDCSESFYRKEVELDVKNAPSASVEEKRRMMDLLKRFEEDSLDESPLLADSDNEDEEGDEVDDLHRRLQGIDLDDASYDDIWNALTPEERDKFMRAVNDPNSDLAKQLLASEELERAQIEPWWEAPTGTEGGSLEGTPSSLTRQKRRHGSKPPIMTIPQSLVKQSSSAAVSGPLLLYNICALCIAYTYAVRHFAVSPLASLAPTDPDRTEVRRSISQLVPFLVDRRSTMVHMSLSAAVTDLWSHFPSGHMDPQFFSLLLKDTATLLRPATVTVIAPADFPNLEEHPSANALRVLSDLTSLFGESGAVEDRPASSTESAQAKRARPNHILHKLTFYAAYILGTPVPMLRVLVDEVKMRAKTLEDEGKRTKQSRKSENVKRAERTVAESPRIEEL